MTQYTEILERLQGLKEPDREVDAMINIMIHQLPEIENWTNLDIHCLSANSPVTKSLDAAIELCEKMLPTSKMGIIKGISAEHQGTWQCYLRLPENNPISIDHALPSVALLVVMFKTLEELE